MIQKPEILSPAGDLEKMQYAIAYGADAVYLAGKRFGMRAGAGNFTDEEMRKAVQYAHARQVKCYITLNIMPHNHELSILPDYLAFLQEIEVDALIIADVGVLSMAKRYAPRVPVHISTQTSIVNYEAACFWHDLGAERVVLARELTLSDIATIRAKTPTTLSIEAFVHGAMCISYSGRCLISQYMTGRDANHGACAQPCRWNYQLMEEKRPGEYFPVEEDARGTYLYNSKDLCMIEHVPALIEAGIDSFKIEGRAKTAYYAASITGAYRRAVDAYAESKEKDAFVLPAEIAQEVHKVSHRHYYTGFYFGDTKGEHYDDNSYIRSSEISALFQGMSDNGMAIFTLKNRFQVGDTLECIQPGQAPYRFVVDALFLEDGAPVDLVQHPEMRFGIRLPFTPKTFAILRKDT